MNGQQIIDFGFDQTHTNKSNVSIDNQRLYLNLAYIDTIDELIKLKVAFLFDIGTTQSIANQNEYEVKKLGIEPDSLAIKTVRKIFIKYDENDEFHTPADRVNPDILEYHPDWYRKNQPKHNPFFYIADNSFFIFPEPKKNIEGGIEVYVIHDAPEIDENTTEDNIQAPRSYHKAISYKIREYILSSQGKENEAQIAEKKWKNEIIKVNGVTKPRTSKNLKNSQSNLNTYR